jgi:hypothetical protein
MSQQRVNNSIGSPRPAHTYEDEQGLLIRKDPKTGETVGVTILDYEEHFRQFPDLSWLATKSLPEELRVEIIPHIPPHSSPATPHSLPLTPDSSLLPSPASRLPPLASYLQYN